MALTRSASPGVPVILQNGAIGPANGVAIAIPQSVKRHLITIKSSAGVTAGTVQLEAGDSDIFAGTWSPVGGGLVNVPAGGASGSELTINFEGAFNFLRARINDAIANGTVIITYLGIR